MRSVQKNSARHKANGSAVAKLGNKPVTNKEIYDQHGAVVTYPSPDGLMEFSQFMRLPNDLAIEFVKGCCDRYDISIKHISRYLFGLEDDELKRCLERKKIYLQCSPGKKRAKSGLLKFQADVEEWKRSTKIDRDLKNAQERERQAKAPKLVELDAYKAMSAEERLAYVNSVIDFWHVSASTISTELYGKASNYISNYFLYHKLGDKLSRLSKSLIQNDAQMYENRRAFKTYIEAWREFSDIETQEEESKTTAAELEPEEEEYQKAKQKFLEAASKGTGIKILPDDEEFDLDIPGDPSWYEPNDAVDKEKHRMDHFDALLHAIPIDADELKSKIPEPESEPNPMDYHEMHFSVNYIAEEIDMDEFYAIASLMKRHKKPGKRVKVSFEITEV